MQDQLSAEDAEKLGQAVLDAPLEQIPALVEQYEAKINSTKQQQGAEDARSSEIERLNASFNAPTVEHPVDKPLARVVLRPAGSQRPEHSDLSATIAHAQARSAADRALRAHREAHDKRLDRKSEFERYFAAGQPNGELTPAEKREWAKLQSYDTDAARAKIRAAEAAHRNGDYEQVHRILRG